MELLHECIYYRDTLYVCKHKNRGVFIMQLLYVCLSIFCFDSALFLVIVCMPPSSNHLKSNVNIFIHDAFHLPEISPGGGVLFTATLALKITDSNAYLLPSLVFNRSSKKYMHVPILTR